MVIFSSFFIESSLLKYLIIVYSVIMCAFELSWIMILPIIIVCVFIN